MESSKSAAELTRRDIIRKSSALAAGAVVLAASKWGWAAATSSPAEPEVTPLEDLMREHGLYERLMVIFDHYRTRIDAMTPHPTSDKAIFGLTPKENAKELSDAPLAAAAVIMRTFIGDYHEKLEEDYVFPRLQKAGKEVELTKVLRAQHDAGRKLNAQLEKWATPDGLRDGATARRISECLRRINVMYLPHIGRENTVLFPAFKSVVPAKELDELGDKFEKIEHDKFGDEGFEKVVAKLAEIEKPLGLADLSVFTQEEVK